MRRKNSSLALVLLIMTAVGCSVLQREKVLIPSERDLRTEYKKSKDDFKAKYDGKEVSVWGKVALVDMTGSSGRVRLDYDSDILSSEAPQVSCVVDEADKARFDDLNVDTGTLIRLKGKMDTQHGEIRLQQRKLEKIGLHAMSDE